MPETQEEFIRRVTHQLENNPFNLPEDGDAGGGDWGGYASAAPQDFDPYAQQPPDSVGLEPARPLPPDTGNLTQIYGGPAAAAAPARPDPWSFGPTRNDMPFGGPQSAGGFYSHIQEAVQTGQMSPQEGEQRMRAYNVERNQNYGRDQGHEAGLIQAQRALAGATLSPAEQLRSQNLRNGLSTIQQQLDNGAITPNQAAELQQQVQQQGQPLWVRESQIPHLMMRAEYQQMQHRAAQQATVEQQNAQFRARTAQGRFATVVATDPVTGQQTSFAEISPGRYERLRPEGDQAGRQNAQELRRFQTTLQTTLRHYEGVARQQLQRARADMANPNRTGAALPGWYTDNPGMSDDERIRQYATQQADGHLRAAGIHPPGSGGQASGGQAPAAATAPSGPAQSEALQRLQALFGPRPAAQPSPAGAPPTPAPAQEPARPDQRSWWQRFIET